MNKDEAVRLLKLRDEIHANAAGQRRAGNPPARIHQIERGAETLRDLNHLARVAGIGEAPFGRCRAWLMASHL